MRAGFAEVFKLGLVRYASSTAHRRSAEGHLQGARGTGDRHVVANRIRGTTGSSGSTPAATSTAKSCRADARFAARSRRTAPPTTGGCRFDAGAQLPRQRIHPRGRRRAARRRRSQRVAATSRPAASWSRVSRSTGRSASSASVELADVPQLRGPDAHRRRASEFNFFPYSESTRRMLTLQYTVGHDYHRYHEVTIYDKLTEQLLDHRAAARVEPAAAVGHRERAIHVLAVPDRSVEILDRDFSAAPRFASSRASRSTSSANSRARAIRSTCPAARPAPRRSCCASGSSRPATSTSSTPA